MQELQNRERAESGVRSQESGVRSQESGVRSQESGVRSQESGVRSQESGVRSQESGVRSQESILSLRRKLQAPIGIRYELENLFVAGLKFVTSLKTPRSQKIMARSTVPISIL